MNKQLDEKLIDKELNRLFPTRSVKKVLLVTPSDVDMNLFDYQTAKRGRYWNFPPYGLGIIASHLRNDDLDVKIINLNNHVLKCCRHSSIKEEFYFDNAWKEALRKEIFDFNPDITGISCMFTQTHRSAVNVVNEVRRLNASLPIAIGGVHITNAFMEKKAQDALKKDFKNADLFFLYEAEIAFKKFIGVINRRISTEELCQVYFNSSAEKFYFSKKNIPKKEELDIIPAHDLMNPTELMDYGVVGSFFCFKEKGTRITSIISNRGCRGQCTYCSVKNFNGQGVRHRSIDSIIDELRLLKDKYDIGHVMWLDDDLFHDHKKTLKLFKEMKKQNIGITWDCTNGVIALSCTDEIIASAEESGCIGITIGVESGNPEILKKIKKPGNIGSFIKAADVLRKYENIVTRVFLMIGFPGETYRMLLDTFYLAMKMNLDWYNITIFEPLPNTPMFQFIDDKGSSSIDFENIRYNSGPYGKIREKIDKDMFFDELVNPFNNVGLDEVPPKSKMNDIWFYMNFNLNFKRLFEETRPLKLRQQIKYLKNIIELIAPEDPFPMYFCGYLQYRIYGSIDKELIARLEALLKKSDSLNKKFRDFNLDIDDLKTMTFKRRGYAESIR